MWHLIHTSRRPCEVAVTVPCTEQRDGGLERSVTRPRMQTGKGHVGDGGREGEPRVGLCLAVWMGAPGHRDTWPTGRRGPRRSAKAGPGGSDFLPLLPCPPDGSSPADIFAVGFEEMVELSAGNIVNAR